MSKFRYGLASLILADIDPANGGALDGTGKELKDVVYRDSFDLVEDEGTTTDHFSEMNPDPEISFTEGGKTTAQVQIMDTSVEMHALLKGGEVVTDGTTGDKTWSKPEAHQNIEKHVTMITDDGYKYVIPRAKIMARKNDQIRRNQIFLFNVSFTPLKPEFEGLAAMDVIEPGA